MFNPYEDSVSSTGEPPTDSSADRHGVMPISGQVISSVNENTNLSTSAGSSRSLPVQEPDSGYEASPSSIAEGHSNQRFFGDQSHQSGESETLQANSDEDFELVECHSQVLFFESDSEDYDTCVDCSSSTMSCNCFRTDSNATATSNCDNDSNELLFHRPSSRPIPISLPTLRMPPMALSTRRVIGSPVDRCPVTRSYPTDFTSRFRFRLMNFPLSLPSISSLMTSRTQHPVRSRREQIDSDASCCSSSSSYGSPEDEGPEDVFNMPSGEASSYPTMVTTMSSVPLPDVVLESTDSGRRSRSQSINLPPDRDQQILQDVGQTLRRLSDLFEHRQRMTRAVMRARSRTTSDCDDHLHKNGLS